MPDTKNKTKSQPSPIHRSFVGFVQALFALAVFAIFVIAWLVQGGSIPLPQWAKNLNGLSPELQGTYQAALIPAVLVLALLFLAAGVLLMLRERRENRNGIP
ncbi:uncharacterized protein GGS25DRAFT_478969 [Hypoxylon fragiforme]|uniref:uncharacterized protein n=1 Tax=Hypoxylon fragiforme TaxID=63214 RepID=UPI0020C6E537|nr:uncharacterized protein GGS25DRAFT_478969 [Hypoxylon fragiforme]KAI2613213.1 hypothetical protein GGS25DRAFT_478969 [Hypoxylon fragiforme]